MFDVKGEKIVVVFVHATVFATASRSIANEGPKRRIHY
jgi:hypothetical protein